jgi:hypothetical protein
MAKLPLLNNSGIVLDEIIGMGIEDNTDDFEP